MDPVIFIEDRIPWSIGFDRLFCCCCKKGIHEPDTRKMKECVSAQNIDKSKHVSNLVF